MKNKNYFITWDLEKTLPAWVSNFQDTTFNIPEETRKKLFSIINETFDDDVINFTAFDDIVEFFKNLNKKDEFILSLEDSIYINDADFYFSSTRTYWSCESILDKPSDYQILQRNWTPINLQNQNLILALKNSNKKEVVICDDWFFSWDTLSIVIENLKEIWISIKEVRLVVNFSWRDNLDWVELKSMKSPCNPIDWLDERDLVYWTKNGWASFKYDWKNNWLPYVFSREIADKKASIPKETSQEFCKKIIDLNMEIWQQFQEKNWLTVKLKDLNRLEFLQEIYNWNLAILDILQLEKNKF